MIPSSGPRLKVGIISDTHIQDEASACHFEKALRYFRDCGVDAVMHVGDISDWGLVSAWRYAAEAWARVFPGDRMPDGHKVEKLFTTGNHDFEGIKYWDQKEEMLANGYSEADLLVENEIEKQWERFFGETFEPVTRKRVKGYDFLTTHWNHRGDIVKWMAAHGGELDKTKPFFFFQHVNPDNTITAGCSGDRGVARKAPTTTRCASSRNTERTMWSAVWYRRPTIAASRTSARWSEPYSLCASCRARYRTGSPSIRGTALESQVRPSGRKSERAHKPEWRSWMSPLLLFGHKEQEKQEKCQNLIHLLFRRKKRHFTIWVM